MLLTYEFKGACSIERFRQEDGGLEPNELAVTARDAALIAFSRFEVEQAADVEKEVAGQERLHASRRTLHKSDQ